MLDLSSAHIDPPAAPARPFSVFVSLADDVVGQDLVDLVAGAAREIGVSACVSLSAPAPAFRHAFGEDPRPADAFVRVTFPLGADSGSRFIPVLNDLAGGVLLVQT